MHIIGEIFRFELQSQARRGSNYAFFAILFLISLGVTGVLGSPLQQMFGAEAPTLANAPFVIAMATLILTMIGMLGLSGGLFGQSATKDFEANFDALLVTSGVSERHFILGRLAAVWMVGFVILLGIPLGLIAGLLLPTNVPSQIGPFRPDSYLYGVFIFILPQVLMFGTLFFAVALLTRRTIWVYLSGLLLPSVIGALLSPLDWIGLGKVSDAVDVFGAGELTRVLWWTVVERNSLAIPLTPILILNRLLWLAVTVAGIWLLARRFKFSQPPLQIETLPGVRQLSALSAARRKPTARTEPAAAAPLAPGAAVGTLAQGKAPSISLQRGIPAYVAQLVAQTRFEFTHIAGRWYFWAVLIVAACMSIVNSTIGLDQNYGVTSYPTTARLLSSESTFTTILTLLLIFLLGESLWRERENNIDGLIDTTPAPSGVFLLGKLLAVVLTLTLAMSIMIPISMAVQTFQGYYFYEIGLYLLRTYTIDLVNLVLMMILALFVYVTLNNKYLGHFVNFLLFIGIPMASATLADRISRLVFYASTPLPVYSDMNGFGHYLGPVRWYQLYWGLAGLIFLLVAQALWPRGAESNLRARLQLARECLHGALRYGLIGAVALFLIVGGWIVYNTRVLYRTAEQAHQQEFSDQASEEAQKAAVKRYVDDYSRLAHAQPVLAGVSTDVDFYPRQRQMTARVRYSLENLTAQPISEILVNDSADPALADFQVNGVPLASLPGSQMERVVSYRVHQFALPQPLPPGQSLELSFTYQRSPSPGFADSPGEYQWVENGSMVLSDSFLPEIGYLDYLEEVLKSPGEKEAKEEQPSKVTPAPDDVGEVKYLAETADRAAARLRPAFRLGARRIPFQGVICTDPDQIAFLPGSLKSETQRAGRRCFEYQSDAPMLMQFFIVSGRYAKAQEQYKGVNLEVFYHPSHAFNIGSLMDAMKTALEVNGQAYSPYPYRQLRIIETPAYADMAVSTPGTVVFGEGMGMYSRIPRQQPGVVDYPFFVASHETAHQWWGEQLIPARAAGLHVILETLTQYSAVKSVDKFYGVESVRNFLNYEMRKYVENRLGGSDAPLAQVTGGKDSHVYYRKGAVVMYTLRDYLGAAALDGTLRQFMDDFRQGPPYPLSADLMDYLRRAAPPDRQQVITDLIETITFWDFKAENATFLKRPDGQYDVTLTVRARKMRSDALGNETPVEMIDDPIDIGVMDIRGKFIYLARHPIHTGENIVTLTVPELPVQAGIDPVYKLIDRIPGNNMRIILVKPAPASSSSQSNSTAMAGKIP